MQDKGKRIVFVGYMYSGKTTIGKKLAQHLDYKFYDIDTEIENKIHHSVADIFKLFGEDTFRKLEQQTLKELLQKDDVIIACGGGTPCFFDNMQQIKEKSISIYIKVDIKHIIARQKYSKAERPLLSDKTEKEIRQYITESLDDRKKYYSQADIISEDFNFSIKSIVEKLSNFDK